MQVDVNIVKLYEKVGFSELVTGKKSSLNKPRHQVSKRETNVASVHEHACRGGARCWPRTQFQRQ